VPVFYSESGFRSVQFAARLNGVKDPQLGKSVRDLLAAVGLAEDRKDARQYSRGMQQRLALAQALINDPEVLILDEPAAALDPAGVLQVRELLRTARQAGKSIFFSSHQLSEVEQICDRIAFLNQGALVRCGSLKELLSDSNRIKLEVREAGKTELTRMVIEAKEQRRVIEGVWQAGGEIVSLEPMRRRLEELFLEWSGR
jgi:ABC-2 type transport system ATP-binding protein